MFTLKAGYVYILESFWHNPQYRITLVDVDDDDDDGKCTLIVALMQKNRRSQRNMGLDVLTIGFAIYHVSRCFLNLCEMFTLNFLSCPILIECQNRWT